MGTSFKAGDVILIPGIPTFRKSIVPPLSIQLPLAAHCSRRKYVLMGLFWSFCALAMMATALTFFVDSPESNRTLFDKIAMALLELFGLYWVPFLSAAAAFAFLDAGLSKPVLIIDENGMSDNRSGLSVKWTDLFSAKPIMGRAGYWGVSLQVRKPTLLPKSLRLGYPLLRRRKVNEAQIQCNLLSVPTHEIVNSMMTLVHKNGGRLFPAHPVFWSSVPPVVPQQ